ncbi:MAG: L-serine ammonia-lyase, iron-sulfur-dependent, subunit alpha [Clostridia bacterium]|nr:L-serine ammonia-lyase, iron-sulfur-dependent, subunit alpha [Clostridia bacterium]
MQSLKELYRIGRGPSSSHTIGPEKAALYALKKFPTADKFSVTLYGSLAKTGKGHCTDKILKETFSPVPTEIVFDCETPTDFHENTLDVTAYIKNVKLGVLRFYSIGGGEIVVDGEKPIVKTDVYPLSTFTEISDFCQKNGIRLWEFATKYEGEDILDYAKTVWSAMKNSIREGLNREGVLHGGLGTERKAKKLFGNVKKSESDEIRQNRIVGAYAFAVSEQNASGGTIVTAPTCGSSGVVPSVLKYAQETAGFTDEEIAHALLTAGIIGNLIKTNASISGAECGCQAEIGSACSMAAAGLGELYGLNLKQIEYAAEIAMEHHLGLTCDPIAGLVQIPCIERNAVAAMRAINAVSLAELLADMSKISFDLIVKTMYNTGKDLPLGYRETASGGLAKYYPAEFIRSEE